MTLSAALRGAVQQQARWSLQPVPVTGGLFVDMSNWTGPLDDGMLDDLQAAGYVGAVVQAITGANGVSYTRQQLDMLTRRGLRTAGYVWSFPNVLAGSMTSRLAMFDGYSLEFLALDVEEVGLARADVDRDLPICDAYTGQRTWVYSGGWFWALQGWGAWWPDRDLWDSSYDNVPDLDVGFVSYGGWTKRRAKQFAGSSSIGRLHQVDLNILGG